MHRTLIRILASALLIAAAPQLQARTPCETDRHARLEETLECYRHQVERQPLHYALTETSQLPGVEKRTYRLTSQYWSPQNLVSPSNWDHDVTLYIPAKARSRRALVIANNGVRLPQNGAAPTPPNDFTPETLATLATDTRTVVVSISDIPNQFLAYADDGKPRAEDDSVAHSWTLFMQDPERRATVPLHVPMAAAVWRGMTLAERELGDLKIKRFIVSGISKRGWITWLAAIGDPRIDAIAPFAIDLLSTRDGLKNMYRSYGGNWPVAFYPYYAEGIDRAIDTPAFGALLKIEDPLAYLGTRYGKRLAIPKYVVNASGDDFFVPDNASLYFNRLPGEKALRMVPNSSHAGIREVTLDSLTAFVNRFQRNDSLPRISARLHETGKRTSIKLKLSETPASMRLWEATNPQARDFRYACGIRYTSTPVQSADAPPRWIAVEKPATGWRAYFVEATFRDGFIATSETFILGDGYPNVAPPSSGGACATLPGRGIEP